MSKVLEKIIAPVLDLKSALAFIFLKVASEAEFDIIQLNLRPSTFRLSAFLYFGEVRIVPSKKSIFLDHSL